jgi:hypothetical protein
VNLRKKLQKLHPNASYFHPLKNANSFKRFHSSISRFIPVLHADLITIHFRKCKRELEEETCIHSLKDVVKNEWKVINFT